MRIVIISFQLEAFGSPSLDKMKNRKTVTWREHHRAVCGRTCSAIWRCCFVINHRASSSFLPEGVSWRECISAVNHLLNQKYFLNKNRQNIIFFLIWAASCWQGFHQHLVVLKFDTREERGQNNNCDKEEGQVEVGQGKPGWWVKKKCCPNTVKRSSGDL